MAERQWAGNLPLNNIASISAFQAYQRLNDDEDTMEHNQEREEERNLEDDDVLDHTGARGNTSGSGSGGSLMNKPKPTRPHDLRGHVFEIVDGSDIKECIRRFVRRNNRRVVVLSAKGSVKDVKLRVLHLQMNLLKCTGTSKILSLSGTFMHGSVSAAWPPEDSDLTLYMRWNHGEVMGGIVFGSLVASGPVILMAISFSIPKSECLSGLL